MDKKKHEHRGHKHDNSEKHGRGRGRGKYDRDDQKSLLEVNDLVVEYTSGGAVVQAVNGVSLSLNQGETLGLVGETGAGKTTIAKAILQILPDPPAKIRGGEIWFHGKDLVRAPERELLHIRGNKISMIFQDPMTALNPTMSAFANFSKSKIVSAGFATDSPNTSFVFSLNAALSSSSVQSGSTNVTSMPMRFMVTEKRL